MNGVLALRIVTPLSFLILFCKRVFSTVERVVCVCVCTENWRCSSIWSHDLFGHPVLQSCKAFREHLLPSSSADHILCRRVNGLNVCFFKEEMRLLAFSFPFFAGVPFSLVSLRLDLIISVIFIRFWILKLGFKNSKSISHLKSQ